MQNSNQPGIGAVLQSSFRLNSELSGSHPY